MNQQTRQILQSKMPGYTERLMSRKLTASMLVNCRGIRELLVYGYFADLDIKAVPPIKEASVAVRTRVWNLANLLTAHLMDVPHDFDAMVERVTGKPAPSNVNNTRIRIALAIYYLETKTKKQIAL